MLQITILKYRTYELLYQLSASIIKKKTLGGQRLCFEGGGGGVGGGVLAFYSVYGKHYFTYINNVIKN